MIQATLNNRIFNLQIFSTVRFDNMQTMTVFVYGIWTVNEFYISNNL